MESIDTSALQPPVNSSDKSYFEDKRNFFDTGATLEYEFRIKMLEKLEQALRDHEAEIYEALKIDLRKSTTEAYFGEFGFLMAELKDAQRNLKRWIKPKRVKMPLVLEPGSSKTLYRPKGVVLIIAPWNYPIQLVFGPLIAAIAAGNCALIKPSEENTASPGLIEKIVQATFEPNFVSVVQGLGSEIIPNLLDQHTFNHIFFTGSPGIGSKIAQMAAPSLTSYTLELGGKNPAIVDSTANLSVSAKRLVWGAFMNAGQVCVRPDYILVEESFQDKLIEKLKTTIAEFYGDDPSKSEDYPRIVNTKRFDVLLTYLSQGNVLHGGRSNRDDLYLEPTILEVSDEKAPVLHEEIFGPILLIRTFKTNQDILNIVRRNRYPLATYYFGTNKEREKFILERIEYGGASINNVAAHMGNPSLPFGGIQTSGQGAYHGFYGFKCFSEERAIYNSATWVDPDIKYAPFNAFKLKWLKRFMEF